MTAQPTVPTRASASMLGPNWLEVGLAIGFALIFAGMVYGMARGLESSMEAPAIVWLHLAVILIVAGLTPVMMLRRRGDRSHRVLGWIWCTGMFASAIISLGIRHIGHGRLSGIHVLSFIYLLLIPLLILAARSHRRRTHRVVVAIALSILLLAGAATFVPPRFLGSWMFGVS